ncbi:MAG: response regulator [Nitrospiraceae bacterium]
MKQLLENLRSRWSGSIRLRHTVGYSAIILVIMTIGSSLMLYEQGSTIRQAAEARGLAFSRTFALMGAAAVLDNLFLIQEAMNQYLVDQAILQIDVIDPESMIVASKHPERIGSTLSEQDWLAPAKSQKEATFYTNDTEGQPILVIIEPLLDGGKIAAWTRVIFSLSEVQREEVQAIQRMLFVTLALIAAGIVGVHFAQRQVSHVFRGIVAHLQGAVTTLGMFSQKEFANVVDAAGAIRASQFRQGEFEYLTSVVTQTAELLKKQSQTLRESEMKFRSVAQSANDAIVSAAQQGAIIAWNKGAEDIFGYQEQDVLGKPLTILMPERYRAQHQEGLDRMRETGQARVIGKTLELAGVRKNGSEFPLELSIATWKTGEGTFYTEIIRDITERKQTEEALHTLAVSLEQKVKERTAELEIARDQAMIATRHKSEFLAGMSHELRTPLNAVIGFSEVLLEKMFGNVNPKQEEYLQDILSSGRHLLALINDILDLAKIESGRLELDLSTFDLPTVLQNALSLVRERANRHDIRLDLEFDERLGDFTADERKVKQILLNLLSNALKFTPDGGNISLKAGLSGGCAEISVTDTGIGIAQEDQQKIFEEFFQSGDHVRKREGTGLGLALTRKFVELHGGLIWVQSEKGHGSRFSFTLPIRGALEKTKMTVAEESTRAANRPLVLVVEDDLAAAKLLSIYLTEAGFAVEIAQDAQVGLEKARTLRPAVITLDIMMPEIDGWDLLTRMKADPQIASIPVVVVSIVDERGRGFALGAADYLTKPVEREELIGAIQRVSRRGKAGDRHATILAIDDDPLLLELMEAILKPEGFTIIKANGGRAGLQLAREYVPDLIVLDLLMPDLDGFQVVDELKHDPVVGTTPILVLTNKTLSREEKERLNGQITDLKQKATFSRTEFVAHIHSLLKLGEPS